MECRRAGWETRDRRNVFHFSTMEIGERPGGWPRILLAYNANEVGAAQFARAGTMLPGVRGFGLP